MQSYDAFHQCSTDVVWKTQISQSVTLTQQLKSESLEQVASLLPRSFWIRRQPQMPGRLSSSAELAGRWNSPQAFRFRNLFSNLVVPVSAI